MANEVKLKLAITGAQAVRQDIDSVNVSLGDLGRAGATAAKAAAGVFAGFAASMTIGKIVAVQREFDVLNSSLITVTGSSAAAAREMAWIKTFAKDTPFGLAQATQGFVKMKALGLDPTIGSLTSFGNTASAMGKDLNQMVEAVADAATGEFERLKEFGIKASKQGDEVKLTFQGVTTTVGNSAKEITGYLEGLGNNQFAGAMALRAATLDGAIAGLGDTWDELFRTVSTNNAGSLIYDGVTLATKAIEDATTVLNSMTSAAQANAQQTGAMATVQGALATVFETVAVLGVNLKYVLVQVGTELGGLAAQAVQILQGNFAGAAAIRREMLADSAAARREVDATTAAILMAREHARTAGAVNAQAQTRLDRQGADATTSVTTATQTHTAATKAQEAAAKAAAKAQEELTKSYTAQAQTLADIRNKEYDDIDKYMAAQNLAAIEAGNAADAAVRGAQLELDQRGLLKSGIAETTAARLTEQLVTKTAGSAAYDSLVRQIEAQKQLANIYRQGEALDAVDELAKENKKAAEESSKYWEDALMRAFESGKGFFDSLWSTIKNTLKTQVLKVTVQGVMGTLGIGAAGAASASVGSGTDLLGLANTASTLSNLYSAGSSIVSIGGQVAAGTMGIANALGTMAANATGTGITGLLATNGAYGTAAAGTASAAAGSATAGLAAIPGWGWAAMAALAVIGSGVFDGGGGPKTESSYGNMAGLGNTSATGLAGSYSLGVEAAWSELAKQLELTTALKVGTFVGIDGAGDAMTQFNTSGTVNGQSVYNRGARMGGYENVGRSEEALQAAMTEETTRILFSALKASDLPAQYKTYLGTVGSTVSEMTVAMSNVAVIHDFTKALDALPFANLKALSFDAAMGLITVAGGLDNLQANLGSYYTNFYTAEEQRLQTSKAINAATAGSGLDAATATKETFRAIVEAQDLTTASGQQMYATLLGVSGQFATLADAAEASAKATADAAARAADAVKSAFQSAADSMVAEINRIRGVSAGDSAMGMAQAQSAFTMATAQARAGDQAAASQLPDLSQALLSLAETNAVTLADLQRIRGLTAASLTDTSSSLAATYGLTLPSFDMGTNYVPRDMIAMIHEGEEITPRAYNPAAGGSRGDSAEVVLELKRLRQDNANMRTELQAIATHAAKTAKILARVTQNGESVLTTAA